VSSIVWTHGCNWECAYCHASHLITDLDKINLIDEEKVFDYIKGKSGWIDGICISGGEPTLQTDLIDFIKRVKEELNIAVKLETNGSNPKIIRQLLKDNLLDCLCLDFKQLPENVLAISGQTGGTMDLLDSYNAAFRSDIEVEFHTTLCPPFINIDSIAPMAEFLHNKGIWILQQYSANEVLLPNKAGDRVYSKEETAEILAEAQKYHDDVTLV